MIIESFTSWANLNQNGFYIIALYLISPGYHSYRIQFNLTYLIDLIFVNKTDDVVLTAVTPPISDHSGTIVSLNTLNFKKPPKEVTLYDYDLADWTTIESRLTDLKT